MRAGRTCGALALLLVGLARLSFAAEEPGADELFQRARELAFSGRRQEARELCAAILERNPGYHDVRILLGRLRAWDGEHERARELFREVLDETPDYADARCALIDDWLWTGRPEAALAEAERGLAISPDHPELAQRRARALALLAHPGEAPRSVGPAAGDEPAGVDAGRPLYEPPDEALRNRLSADYGFEDFDDDTERWHELSLGYRRETRAGPVLGWLNLARRFGETGQQVELEAYPRLPGRNYLFVNLGLSSGEFPDLSYAGEVYHNFPRGWEASAGFRRLEFQTSDLTIYTATGARYVGPYWISLRPSYIDKSSGRAVSAGLSVRRYFDGRHEYAELAIGGGASNEDRLIIGREGDLDSFRLRLELRRRVRRGLILKGSVGYRSREFESGPTRGSVFAGIGLEKYF